MYDLYSQYLNKANMRDVLVYHNILVPRLIVYVVFQLIEIYKMEVPLIIGEYQQK